MINLKNISMAFNDNNRTSMVMKKFNLIIPQNEFICILGPSGCGKTTILNLIAKFLSPSSGEIVLGKTTISKPLKISFVFQDHNIFPWKTVRQNIEFGLTSEKIDRISMDKRVEKIAKDVGLSAYLNQYPKSLSGGMQQRVGIARALICRPDILLMDEPFAALDALTASTTRKLLTKLCKKYSATVVFVTHNIDEALELGSRVIVVSPKPMRILLDTKPQDYKHDTLRSKIYKIVISDTKEKGT